MVQRQIVFFDRPVSAVRRIPGPGSLPADEADGRVQEAMHAAVERERQAAAREIEAVRRELAALSSGALSGIMNLEAGVTQQLQQALPALALEIAQRMLAGFQPPADVIERLCREVLEQLYPEREGLEVSLCPRDLQLLQSLNPEWLQRYAGLRLVADADLSPGDCMVRSRFGLTDARQKTKLAALARGLAGQ